MVFLPSYSLSQVHRHHEVLQQHIYTTPKGQRLSAHTYEEHLRVLTSASHCVEPPLSFRRCSLILSLTSLSSFWVEKNKTYKPLFFQACKSYLHAVPKDLSQAAWFPCSRSQDNAQDPNEERMPLGGEKVWLKVSEGVWSGTERYACLYPNTLVTKASPLLPFSRSYGSLKSCSDGTVSPTKLFVNPGCLWLGLR